MPHFARMLVDMRVFIFSCMVLESKLRSSSGLTNVVFATSFVSTVMLVNEAALVLLVQWIFKAEIVGYLGTCVDNSELCSWKGSLQGAVEGFQKGFTFFSSEWDFEKQCGILLLFDFSWN